MQDTIETVAVAPVNVLSRVRRGIASALLTVAFVVAGGVAANASTPTLDSNVSDFQSGITTTFLTTILPAVFALGLLFVGAAVAWKWMRRAAKSS